MRCSVILGFLACAAAAPAELQEPPAEPEPAQATTSSPVPLLRATYLYWIPEGTPKTYNMMNYSRLSEPNATCVLQPNATFGSFFGEAINGTFCEACTWLPGLESPLMTEGLPCRTIYLIVATLLALLFLLISSAMSSGSKSGAKAPLLSRDLPRSDSAAPTSTPKASPRWAVNTGSPIKLTR